MRQYVKRLNEKSNKMPSRIALVLCPIVTFYLFDLYTHNPFVTMGFETQLLNIVFYELMSFILLGIFKYVRLALMIQSGLFMIVGLVNYYVVNFRSAPIRPWDIFSIQTAVSVADNYNYKLETDTIFILVSFVILLIVESRFSLRVHGKVGKRMLLILLPAVVMWGYVELIQNDRFVAKFGLYDKYFTPTVMNKRDGNAVAFIMAMEYLDVEKPGDYSKEEVEQFFQQGEEASEGLVETLKNPQSVERPNIIVIMNEAFSDLSVLGEFTTNQEYMPFIRKLQEGVPDTITGTLNVSVLGGNTANTEFEFLTGNTMAFLPQGSVPYQQYMQDEVPSLSSYLKELGYQTVAIHPYNADGWDRDRIYPMLGFDSFFSLKNFGEAERIRNYVSDDACYDKIIEMYETKKEDKPLFVFNVTMQNHSGYTEEFDNFVPDVSVEGVDSKALSMYMSLIKESDKALERLVTYFEKVPEDTMIVFFGDHQPTTYVSNPIVQNQDIMLKYKVPYVIWSNFDIDEKAGQETSVNYLSIDILEQCSLPLPVYQNILKDIREEYPVVSAMRAEDKDGKQYTPESFLDILRDYHNLEYYLLFDYNQE